MNFVLENETFVQVWLALSNIWLDWERLVASHFQIQYSLLNSPLQLPKYQQVRKYYLNCFIWSVLIRVYHALSSLRKPFHYFLDVCMNFRSYFLVRSDRCVKSEAESYCFFFFNFLFANFSRDFHLYHQSQSPFFEDGCAVDLRILYVLC